MSLSDLRRHLPGTAGRNGKNEIIFLKGYVIYASSRVQWVETESKIHRIVSLIGETFLYVCDRCVCSVLQCELIPPENPFEQPGCPFCQSKVPVLHQVRVGDKVRVHFRYAKDHSSAAWWGERWEW